VADRTTRLSLDGSEGEGGGQVLRSALALSMVTGRAFRMRAIRAGRAKPGLLRQHLTAVLAAVQVTGAECEGAAVGSTELSFAPGAVRGGEHRFSIGTAGSTLLVAQTLLPALLTAAAPSRLILEGGTHNPLAPPFEFFARAFLPLVCRMGPRVATSLERHGFYPAGGGRMTVTVDPAPRLAGFELHERGALRARRGSVLLAELPAHIGEREVEVLRAKTGWDEACFSVQTLTRQPGPGNVVLLEVESEHVIEVFTGFGAPSVRAEAVAGAAVDALRRYIAAGVPVGEHLADQLLVPLALAGSGAFTTQPLSRHATTQIDLIRRFLDVPIAVDRPGPERQIVRIGPPAS
jgi:RNA 3'-terminal phosphate cyclase (ATP)